MANTKAEIVPGGMSVENPELAKASTALLAQAKSMFVRNPAEQDRAAALLREIKLAGKKVAEFFAPMKKAAKAAHDEILATERRYLAAIVEAEGVLKATIIRYQDKVEAENRKAREAALKAVEKANVAPEVVEAFRAAPVPEAPRAAGFSKRTIWNVEVHDLPALAKFAVENGLISELLDPNYGNLASLARDEEGRKRLEGIPGITVVSREVGAMRT